jgi:cell division protein FtsN
MQNMQTNRKQTGNTLLGLIIGLIIGLVIAVVVALVITKGQSPFTNKTGKTEQAAPTAGQAADPNRTMYGKQDAARDAAKELAGRAAAVVPGAAPSTTATPAAAGAAKKPDAAAAKADDDKFTYYLQAGAFREQADAENARAKLALLGFEANISDKGGDAVTLYRVRVGPFSTADAMNKVKTKLSESGVDVAVVRNPR